ncbi:MAG: class A beta-lactamase-related serine hydrolase [Rhodanobacteraceae bacterium]|nr:MAG: class A beta-lactamase-related serine hydrolase [Rhodanobacteraceae bacterium]
MILIGYAIILAAFLAWNVWNGSADSLLAAWMQRRRRQRYRTDPDAVSMQAAANGHAAVMAPNAGVAVAVVTPAGVRHVFAGQVDGADSPAPDADTRFEIGSLTKTFTAALLVAMQRQGLVRLDTRLDALLPPDARLGKQQPVPATLTSLATHTSGLPRLPWGLPMLAGLYCTPRQPYRFIGEKTLTRWLRHRRIRFGGRHRYSNLGYGLLGQVLARRAGVDYAGALQHFVLEPLGLDGVTAAADAACAQPHTSLGRRTPAWNLRALTPAGGLRASLADMTRWLQANMAEQPPLDARLHTARENSGGLGRSIALGWHVDGEGDRRAVWHNGRTGGSSSVMAFAPAHGIGIVVLSNSAASVDALGLRLLHATAAGADDQSGNAAPVHMQRITEPY